MKKLVMLGMLLALMGCSAPVSADQAAWSRAKGFTQLVWAADFEGAAALVAPDSPASRYLTHVQALGEATADLPVPASPSASASGQEITLQVAEDERRITIVTGEVATRWHTFTHDAAGLVTGWSIDDDPAPLAARLWSEPASRTTPAGTIELVSGYRNADGVWLVIRITPDATVPADQAPTFVDATASHQAFLTSATGDLAGDQPQVVAIGVKGATLPGTLTYRIGKESSELPVR